MSSVDRLTKCEDKDVQEMAANILQFPDPLGIQSVRDGLALMSIGIVDDDSARWVQRAVGDKNSNWKDASWRAKILAATDLAEEIMNQTSI